MSNHDRVSDDDLHALFEEIDEELGSENPEIPRRPIHAAGRVAERLGVDLRIFDQHTGRGYLAWRGGKIGPIFRPEEIFVPWKTDYIWARLERWYEQRYGERLRESPVLGTVVLEIRGSYWQGQVYEFYGSGRFYCSRKTAVYRNPSYDQSGFEVNLLDSVADLPSGLRERLTDEELNSICKQLLFGHEAYGALHSGASNHRLSSEALTDHKFAVENLVGSAPNPARSKWASIEAAEKTLKAAIAQQGCAFSFNHDLRRHATVAEQAGFPAVPQQLIDQLSGTPALRYGGAHVTPREALEAHHASLEIARLSGVILGNRIKVGST